MMHVNSRNLVWVWLLALLLALFMASCGGDSEDAPTAPEPSVSDSESRDDERRSDRDRRKQTVEVKAKSYNYSNYEQADADLKAALEAGDPAAALGIWNATPLEKRFDLYGAYSRHQVSVLEGTDFSLLEKMKPFTKTIDVDEAMEAYTAALQAVQVPTATITGRVTDAVTGAPVANAEVQSGASRTTTDEDGNYRLEGVPEGNRSIVAMKHPDYDMASTRIDFVADQVHQQDFQLTAAEAPAAPKQPEAFGDVELVLLDAETGKPLANAPVTIATEYDARNIMLGNPSHAGMTDAEGKIRLEQVPSGVHSLLVFHPPKYTYNDDKFEVKADELRSETLEIPPLGGKFEMPAIVRGTVRDSVTGQPIEGARVGTATFQGDNTDKDGKFFYDTKPGPKTLDAKHKEYHTYEQPITLVAGNNPVLDIALQPITTGNIIGTAINAITGEPLADAVITIAGQTIRTDSEGKFELDEVESGEVRVTAAQSGFEASSDSVALEALATAETVLELQPITEGTVAGQVLSATDRSPLAEATVSAGGITVRTDAEGRFSIEKVQEGVVTVIAQMAIFEAAEETIELKALTTETVELLLTPITYGSVSGIVQDATTGAPLAEVTVSIAGLSVGTDGGGNFLLEQVPAGDLALTASLARYHDKLDSFSLTPTETVERVVELDPITTGTVTGTVTDAVSGQAIAGAAVTLGDQFAETDAAGRFSVEEVTAGDISLNAQKVVYEAGLATAQLEAASSVDVVIQLQPITYGTITGTVLDATSGQPITGASVTVTGGQASTDDTGRFTIEQVSAGDVLVSASKAIFEPGSQNTQLEPAGTSEVTIRLEPVTYGDITGVVVDSASGEPLEGVKVSAGAQSAKTGADGRFVFEKFGAGSINIAASKLAYHSGGTNLNLAAGATAEVEVALDPITVGTVTGVVIDAKTKDPVAGARVTLGQQAMETGADGRFGFEEVQAGSVAAAARHADYANGAKSGQLEGAGTLELVVEMDLRREDITALESALAKDGTIDLYGIYFDSGKDQFKPSSLSTLQAVLQVIRRAPDKRFQIAGHTDSDGDDAYNQDLSERRAATVIQWLVDNGADAAQLASAGFGEARPAAPNDTVSGKALNRRVQLSIVN